ncbi:PAS domain S-box protein [Natronococcus wangiae]|uniref:PAS domain S-box protein n=1 Tax=Natronococcus wangiae TaxID=3068275 RepID=UPI00273FE01B|nr:PAS domain S-box protein [Natronococcus sp. AD5]
MSERAAASGMAFWGDADDIEARERYQTLVNAIDDGICQLDDEGRFVAVNDVIVEMTGYAGEELLGERISAFLDGGGSTLEREIERLRAEPDERSELLELALRTADGERTPCEVRVSQLESDDTVRGAVGIVRDITERKRRERRTRFLDRLGRTLQPLTDPDEVVATTDRLLGEQLGVDRCVYAEVADDEDRARIADCAPDDAESIVDRRVISDFGDEVLELMRENRAYVVDDVDTDERITEADREAYDRAGIRSLICVPLHEDGAFTAVVIVHQETPRDWRSREVDLVKAATERCREALQRARTMRELRERQQHLNALVETTPECIKTVAADGTLLQMNPAGLDMVEAGSASSVIGESVYGLIAPEHREKFRAFNERICQGERDTLEFDIIGLEGTRRHMETHAAPLHSPDGTISQVALTRDVTEQVEREQQLEETVRKLEESNERLEQFAYAASHDLQEPLRMVSSYLRLIERRYADELDEEGQEFIDFAVDGADRMRNMIDALLEYSRVETRGDPLEPLELDAVLADVRDDLQVRIEETGAEITADSLPRVEGDEEQLRRVFQNLLDNAIEYSGDEPPRMDVSAERDGAEWIVSVSDDGIGIDPDDADRVFEVFQSLHTSDEHAGTGIGLALCERIVERHDGEIWVGAEPGDGATFSFTLPAASDRER